MKTITLNAFSIISMIGALLLLYSGYLTESSPRLALWMGAVASASTVVLRTFFPTGTWIAAGWNAALWIVNGGYIASMILSLWSDMGVVSATVVNIIVGTINVVISYFGVTYPPATFSRKPL